MAKKKSYVCIECNSKRVQAKAWVDLNTNAIDWSLSEAGDSEDYWCEDCKAHNKVVYK